MDGFYAAYLTGSAGSSIAIFVFQNNKIAGADAGGGKYDGEYKISEDGESVIGNMKFSMPVGGSSITGASATTMPILIDIPFKIPLNFSKDDIILFNTPIGPVNAKLVKIRNA
jgi:hypothetical protein